MDAKELLYNLKIISSEEKIPIENIKPISKNDLVIGEKYFGICRNSSYATWNGNKFEYERYKMGMTYTDAINHFEDDNGYDVFIPVKIIT